MAKIKGVKEVKKSEKVEEFILNKVQQLPREYLQFLLDNSVEGEFIYGYFCPSPRKG